MTATRTGALIAGWVLATTCARIPPLPVIPPAPPGGGEDLIVRLSWTAPVDLDLYVTDPPLETLYYANRRTAQGGILEHDVGCDRVGGGSAMEVSRWQRPPAGRWRIGVDFPDACADGPDEANYELTIDVRGERQVVRGRAALGHRDPAAAEFEVQ